MRVIEQLTMAEMDELANLAGVKFSDIMENGIEPGRQLACLAWILDKRQNPASAIDRFQKMTLTDMHEFLKGFASDPKEETTSN